MTVTVTLGNCLDVLARRDGPLFDAVVCDPPYHLTSIVKRFGAGNAAPCKEGATGAYARAARGFMGKTWDGGDVAFRPETWAAIGAVMKPGAHLIAFSGCRTYHRMACAIEDAGFEIREMLAWTFGSGFPKSHDVSKGIDRAAGAVREVVGLSPWNERKPNGSAGVDSVGLNATAGAPDITAPATPEAAQWQGWGSALKPALEPICLARWPMSEKTIAANVLRWGTGALNIDACRIESGTELKSGTYTRAPDGVHDTGLAGSFDYVGTKGRWPANLLLSMPCDEYELRDDLTDKDRREVMEWLYANS